MVEVKGSFPSGGASGWHNGDFESKQGVVLSIFDTGNNTFDSTARVRFFQPVDPLQPIVPVPVQYLWPVHPESKGEDILILHGVHKGHEARVEAVEPNNLMVLTTKATFLVVDSPAERLVRIKQIDEVGNFTR